MKTISFAENYAGEKYRVFPFYRNGKPADGAGWGMTLRAAGSMRFRWNEINENRSKMLSEICSAFGGKTVSQVQLDHTKIVFDVEKQSDTNEKIGDGIITQNRGLLPVVTVADCVPIFLFDSESGFFGVVHSGWKGTGIVKNAVQLAGEKYGAKPADISVAIGPHIHDCCYIVNKERADYFALNFTPECIKKLEGEELTSAARNWNNGAGELFRLSLLKANLAVLEKAGILDENIVAAADCTCDSEVFGSNRRETSCGETFTVQAAFTVRH